MAVYDDLQEALRPHGLIPRGGFRLKAADALPGRSLVLIGNAGGDMWQAFAPYRDGSADPLDRWTKRVVDPIAEAFGARAIYPWQTPYQPFQRWAMRAEPVASSPLGILIHPTHGLWHAYRAALVFADEIALSMRGADASPCETCDDKPCLSACPVGAFGGDGYDVDACAGHLARVNESRACHDEGCRARAACPVGESYAPEQVRFHMAAFYGSR